MRDLETARVLIGAASRDVSVLRNMLDKERFPVEAFGFHAQQAVEKSLKAWLCMVGLECPRTHNIRHLLGLLEGAGSNVDDLRDLIELSAFAVQFRYEAYPEMDEALDRSDVLSRVDRLVARTARLFDSENAAQTPKDESE